MTSQGTIPSHVLDAFFSYVKDRTAANGSENINMKRAWADFAQWHGYHNIISGHVRRWQPPLHTHWLMRCVEGEN